MSSEDTRSDQSLRYPFGIVGYPQFVQLQRMMRVFFGTHVRYLFDLILETAKFLFIIRNLKNLDIYAMSYHKSCESVSSGICGQ